MVDSKENYKFGLGVKGLRWFTSTIMNMYSFIFKLVI